MYLVRGDVPGLGGVYLVWGVYVLPGGVPGPGGTCPGGVPGLGGVAAPGGVPAQGSVPGPGGHLVLEGAHCLRGVPAPRGVGTCSREVHLVRGGVCGPGEHLARYSPLPVDRMTDTCKNITFATSLRTVKNVNFSCYLLYTIMQ